MNQGINVFGVDGYDTAAPHAPGDPSIELDDSTRAAKRLVRVMLWALTGAFGVAAWGVSLVAPAASGLAVPLAVLAGAVAVVGLLPGQSVHGWLAVAVAVTGFADAVTTTVTPVGAGWVPITAVALVALQVVVAVAALLLDARACSRSTRESDYAAYAEYVRAYQDYAQQYGSYWPNQHVESHAAGDARAEAAGTAAGDHAAWAAMQAKYAQHVAPVAPSERNARQATRGDTGDVGLPGVDRADRPYRAGGPAAPDSSPTAPGAY